MVNPRRLKLGGVKIKGVGDKIKGVKILGKHFVQEVFTDILGCTILRPRKSIYGNLSSNFLGFVSLSRAQ